MVQGPSRRRLLAAMAALPLLAPAIAPTLAPTAARAALFPADGFWGFVALDRAGRAIGALSYRFARAPSLFDVAVEAFWRLPAAGGGVTLRHSSEERWRDGWLYGIDSRTRLGGRTHRLRVERDDDALRGRRDGHAFTASGYVVPSSLWHPETPRLEALLDSVTGRTRLIRGRRGPTEWVPLGKGRVEATYWRITGELERELWYDAGRRLVRVRFGAPDGSPIVLERRR
ncbi:hypothetical protein SAMN06265365_102241 [Tistlia consotensis]|uniref:DUF3108 domain-containing protein n=1 Tax=Tistlia consotensis USBA 355 TaxID=560819 RepID=A0A1Y6BG63_9PROT|nr:DUF6134 family protein [Tistlia consotensis]SMF07578.1 hypothetical protein SAMN05428998_10475 [Tistlia consotensis USBA 355]SNR35803.1 hypothetical protein SAMN06265365_102241 [Tistlia consotensis]